MLTCEWGRGQNDSRELLLEIYSSDAGTQSIIRSVRHLEIKKRISFAILQAVGFTTTMSTFNALANLRMSTTQERFAEVTNATDSRMNELVIDSFVIPGNGSKESTTFGLVVSFSEMSLI